MARKVKLQGFRELEADLANLTKATGKNVLKRVLLAAADPIESAMEANAPLLTGHLKRDVKTGTRLTRRQARLNRKLGPSAVEVHIGVKDPAGVQTEFGNEHQAAEPWARPAWDAHADDALQIVQTEMWSEVQRATARAARRAARRAGK